MTHLRDPRRYRAQASLFRELAAAASDSAQLRESYLGLALQYERVAGILEVRAPPAACAPADSLHARCCGPYRSTSKGEQAIGRPRALTQRQRASWIGPGPGI